MFASSLNLEGLRFCVALGCGKPLPDDLPRDAKFCSQECQEREELRLANEKKKAAANQ